jgi:hypothetical protein
MADQKGMRAIAAAVAELALDPYPANASIKANITVCV